MCKDNKGFTLVELIVSITIFAIVLAAVFGFMLAGSRTYNTVTNRLDLNLQAQLAMNQISDYIIDCNACLYYSGDRLYIINEGETSGDYTANVFEYKSDGCIYFGTGAATLNSTTGNFTCTVSTTDLLAKNVTGFATVPISSDGVNITSAVFTINFANKSASYSGKKTVALRNMPAIAEVS